MLIKLLERTVATNARIKLLVTSGSMVTVLINAIVLAFSISLFASSVSAQEQSSEANNKAIVEELTREVTELKEEQRKMEEALAISRAANLSLRDRVETELQKLTTNGFASAYFTKANKDIDATGPDPTSGIGLSDEWSLRPDLVFGLQSDYQVTPRLSAVLQLKAEGNNDMDVTAEWAFIRYELRPDLYVRIGRLRIPFYLYSESLDVGYTYPWVRPPIEAYLTDFSHYEGADLQWDFLIGRWANQLQVAYASLDDNVVEVDDSYFLGWTGSADNWTLRASVQYSHRVKLLLEKNNLPTTGPDSAVYSSLGARYDDGVLLVIGELVSYDLADKIPFMGQTNAIFTVGYRLNQWMPFMTLAKGYSTKQQEDNFERHNVTPGFSKTRYSQQSIGVGLRYDINDSLALKTEVVRYNDFEDGGNFGTTNDEGLLDPEKIERLGDSISIFSLGFDLLF